MTKALRPCRWPMTTVEEFAPAKVNLTLHITGQRSDGYHLLDSLVVFPEVGDRVSATLSETLSLEVDGPKASGVPTGPENLMLKAARLLKAGKGASLHLKKNLPHPAGIGGGSSDAAATLRALSNLWEVPQLPAQDVLALGADVPVCMSPEPQIMRGIGDELTTVVGLPPFWVVLVNPGVDCPTGSVFDRLDQKQNAPMTAIPRFQGVPDLADWLRLQRNDLEKPARLVAPAISTVFDALDQDSAVARMSGSGATCFGIYETEAQAKTAAARLDGQGWWIAAAPVR